MIQVILESNNDADEKWLSIVQKIADERKAAVDAATTLLPAQLQQMKEEIVAEFSQLAQGMQQKTLEKLEQMENEYNKSLQEQFNSTREAIISHLTASSAKLQSQIKQIGPSISTELQENVARLQSSFDTANNSHNNSFQSLQKEIQQCRAVFVAELAAQITIIRQEMELNESASSDARVEIQNRMDHIQATLEAVRAVQDNSVYGLYDVPLLAELTKGKRERTFKGVFAQAGYKVYRLHFRCPVCGKRPPPCAINNNGEGYELLVPKGWVTKVSKVLAVSLFALKVISLVTPMLALPHVDMLAEYLPSQETYEKVKEFMQYHFRTDKPITVGDARRMVEGHLKERGLDNYVEVTQEYVNQVRSLLLQVKESSPPRHTGLYSTICETTKECAWVCDGCKDRYKVEGNACLGITVSLI